MDPMILACIGVVTAMVIGFVIMRSKGVSMATTCPTPQQLENRGMMWMIGAFVFCPCHLPITLSALALIFGGTAAGALLRAHPYVAGVIVTALWAAGTWRGYS